MFFAAKASMPATPFFSGGSFLSLGLFWIFWFRGNRVRLFRSAKDGLNSWKANCLLIESVRQPLHCLRQTRIVCARERERRSNLCLSKLRNGLLRFARNDAERAADVHAGRPGRRKSRRTFARPAVRSASSRSSAWSRA